MEEVRRLTPTIIEVVVHAPRQARNFRPGQFFRLQNYEAHAPVYEKTPLLIEPLALTGAWVDRERGLLSLIALELGSSSRLCGTLKKGEPVVVMGPTGAPTEIVPGETVLLAGGGLGNAVLFSIAKAMKEARCRVIYFAGYKKPGDFFKREEIESNTDIVIYSVDKGEPIPTRRPQDRTVVGNIVQAMLAYAHGSLGEPPIRLNECDRIIAIGSDVMMAAVTRARHAVLAPLLKPGHISIASINSPMQCMMKEVCAQCLQQHLGPDGKTGGLRLHLLQSGSAQRFRGLGPPEPAPAAEHGPGEADQPLARASPHARRARSHRPLTYKRQSAMRVSSTATARSRSASRTST